MIKNKKILAIIPARGGSKGIKNKNIVDINGKPLIYYSIREAKRSKYIDKIIVSTDSDEIASISKKYGAEIPFLRPKSLAMDTSKTIDTVIHCIEFLKSKGKDYDLMVLLQPTQPLRKSWHIDEALEFIIDKDEESLISVSKAKEHPILMRKIDQDSHVISLLNENSTKRRQDFTQIYKVNGAIYINKINNNLNNETSLNDNKLAYIMDESYDLDIDEELDLKLARMIIDENM